MGEVTDAASQLFACINQPMGFQNLIAYSFSILVYLLSRFFITNCHRYGIPFRE